MSLERRISTPNSTTTPLGLSATYLGTYDAVQHFSSVTVVIHSDVTSVADGVQLIWSNDGTTAHKTRYYEHGRPGFPFTPDTTGTVIQSQVEGKFLRVRFVKDGAEDQTAFSLQTTFGYAPASVPMRRLKDPLTDEGLGMPVIARVAATVGEENDNNSSTTALGTDEVFEGTPEDVSGYTQITVSVHADEASAANGLSVEFSTDNATWDHVETHTIAADITYSFVFRPKAQWFRLVYTNGTTPQGAFRLQTIYRQTGDGTLAALGSPTSTESASGDGDVIALLKNLRTRIAAVQGFVDGIEALLATISGNVDGLEGFTDGVEASLTTITGHVDGIETLLSGTLTAQGNVAHDGADSGNPVKVGHKALAHGTNPTAVTANDRTDWYASRHGVPWVIGGHPNVISHRVNYTAAQTNAAILTVGSGAKIVVTRVMATLDKAASVNVSLLIGFGATTTPTGAGVVAAHPGIEPAGGFNTGDGSGILGVGGDGEDLRITSSVPTSGSIDITVSYYTVDS